MPLWWDDDGGLPIGVHFLGRVGDEATLSVWPRSWRRPSRGPATGPPFTRPGPLVIP